MSLPADIIQLVGTSSVPVVVAGSVLGVFELGERLASQRAKDALSKWLLSFDVQKAGALPDGTQQLFERIFGERHFSLKCFVLSAAFSVGAMAFIAALLFLLYPRETSALIDSLLQGPVRSQHEQYGQWLWVAVWVPWSILIDYVSLLKTRLTMTLISRMRRMAVLISIAIMGTDYAVYRLLFALGLGVLGQIIFCLQFGWDWFGGNLIQVTTQHFFFNTPFIPRNIDLHFVWFWAGFAPSIWMWLYVATLFVTRALVRSEKLVDWFRWGLDVEKTPFRSIGAVAATLAFIASVVIILVSVEVSRITAVA